MGHIPHSAVEHERGPASVLGDGLGWAHRSLGAVPLAGAALRKDPSMQAGQPRGHGETSLLGEQPGHPVSATVVDARPCSLLPPRPVLVVREAPWFWEMDLAPPAWVGVGEGLNGRTGQPLWVYMLGYMLVHAGVGAQVCACACACLCVAVHARVCMHVCACGGGCTCSSTHVRLWVYM